MNNSRENILSVLHASFIVYDVPAPIQSMLYDAHYCSFWDFFEKGNSDGATYINVVWANAFHPVFVWHDFMMQNHEKFKGEKSDFEYVRDTNLMLKKMMEIYNVIPVEKKDNLDRYAKRTFLKATASKIIFKR